MDKSPNKLIVAGRGMYDLVIVICGLIPVLCMFAFFIGGLVLLGYVFLGVVIGGNS